MQEVRLETNLLNSAFRVAAEEEVVSNNLDAEAFQLQVNDISLSETHVTSQPRLTSNQTSVRAIAGRPGQICKCPSIRVSSLKPAKHSCRSLLTCQNEGTRTINPQLLI